MKILCAIGLVLVTLCASTDAASQCNYTTIDNEYTCVLSSFGGTTTETFNEPAGTVTRIVTDVPVTKNIFPSIFAGIRFNSLKRLEILKGNIESVFISSDLTGCKATLTDLRISNSATLIFANGNDFSPCANLVNFDYTHNRITTIIPGAVKNTALSLNLAHNMINVNPTVSTIFSNVNQLISLTSLNLSSNGITAFPTGFSLPSSRLNTLDLSFNAFSSIADNIITPQTLLEKLYLNNNQMTSLSNSLLSPLVKLTTLNVGSNKITTLAANTFERNVDLISLNISDNALTTLENTLLSRLTKLVTLDLQKIGLTNTSLESLKANISPLTQLKSLNISLNKIGTLSGVLDRNTQLTELYAAEMELNRVDKSFFSALTNLQVLSLSNNKLKELPEDLFERNSALKVLIASGNDIDKLMEKTGERLTSLEYLDFSNCNIDKVQRKFFDKMTNLKVAKFRGNKCIQEDIENFTLQNSLTKFERCFANGATTIILSNLLLAFVILLKFA